MVLGSRQLVCGISKSSLFTKQETGALSSELEKVKTKRKRSGTPPPDHPIGITQVGSLTVTPNIAID